MRLTTTPKRVGKHRLALVTWAGLYPILTLIALAVEPALFGQPTALRTLIMSVIMVPIVILI